MAEAVLRDRVAVTLAVAQPLRDLRPAVTEWVQIARWDHQQRDARNAVVVEPVADQRAALEGRGLDVVEGDGEASE